MAENLLGEPAARRSFLRRLDYLPTWAAVPLGIGLGLLAALSFIAAHPIGGAMAFMALLGLAAALAFSGEPVAVLEKVGPEPPPPLPPPPPGWVEISAGRFMMGSPDDEEGRYEAEGPVHEVRVSAFEIMLHPVTRERYAEVIGKDPGWPEGEADQRPVNNVNWLDAVSFCNKFSERQGFEPCYRIEGSEVEWDRSATGYRLPTEAEWEYACRAGSQTRWSFGDDEEQLERHAWYAANSSNEPHPAGEKEPNAWALYDMHGNVYEWCWDWFGRYPEEPQRDPIGPEDGSDRVLRGGAFFDTPGGLRSADRGGGGPEGRGRGIGFRCVRSPRRQP